MIELFDSHAHLQEPEFDSDRDAVLERAFAAGVTRIVVPAVDIESAWTALTLAGRHAGVYATAGYHPHEAQYLAPDILDDIDRLLAMAKVVAVGEIGLDFYRMLSPREAQVEVFEAMLALAQHHALPVAVHCRDAWEALAEQLVPWARRVAPAYAGRPLGVLHYFTGSLEDARRYADLGFLISAHTSVTHPKAAALRDVFAALPLAALVIETDSPYGSPQSQRGRRNEPANVVEAAKCIAETRGVPFEAVAVATTANACRLFGLPAPSPPALSEVRS